MSFGFSTNSSFNFGNSNTNNNNNNNNANNTSTFSFGSNNNQNGNNTNSNASSLNTTLNFGSSNLNNSSFLGTNTNNNNNNNNNVSTFLNTNTNFNSNSNINISTNNSSQPSFLFGGNNGNNNNNNNSDMMQYNPNNFNDNPLQDMNNIANQYNPNSAQCRFETVLYNKLPRNINKSSFDKPPLIRTQIWEQGIKNNPSPTNLIPVGIRGYQQLNERSNLCLAGHCSSIKRFQEISEKISKLKEEIDHKTKQQIHDLKQQQIHLSLRLLSILRTYTIKTTINNNNNIELQQNQNLNNSALSLHREQQNGLSLDEMKLKRVLDQMHQESQQLMALFQHVNKLSSHLEIEGSSNTKDTSTFMGNNSVIIDGLDHPDPNCMKQMFSFLKQQQQFIGLLAKTVQSDMKDINIIKNGIISMDNKNGGFNNNMMMNPGIAASIF